MEKDTCLRCGADKKETRRLGSGGCSSWGKGWIYHSWGVFEGKTYVYDPEKEKNGV